MNQLNPHTCKTKAHHDFSEAMSGCRKAYDEA